MAHNTLAASDTITLTPAQWTELMQPREAWSAVRESFMAHLLGVKPEHWDSIADAQGSDKLYGLQDFWHTQHPENPYLLAPQNAAYEAQDGVLQSNTDSMQELELQLGPSDQPWTLYDMYHAPQGVYRELSTYAPGASADAVTVPRELYDQAQYLANINLEDPNGIGQFMHQTAQKHAGLLTDPTVVTHTQAAYNHTQLMHHVDDSIRSHGGEPLQNAWDTYQTTPSDATEAAYLSEYHNAAQSYFSTPEGQYFQDKLDTHHDVCQSLQDGESAEYDTDAWELSAVMGAAPVASGILESALTVVGGCTLAGIAVTDGVRRIARGLHVDPYTGHHHWGQLVVGSIEVVGGAGAAVTLL